MAKPMALTAEFAVAGREEIGQELIISINSSFDFNPTMFQRANHSCRPR